jgi:type II secretory pathway predicted ATPase ExeA
MPYPYDFTAQSTGEVIAATDINELQTAIEDIQNRVGATALTGTPAAGKTVVATSATAAEWQTASTTSPAADLLAYANFH